MTPARVAVVALTLVLAALLAVGAWGSQGQGPRLSDDEYIAIALSAPEVFHPRGPTSGGTVSARVDHNAPPVAVDVVSDGIKFRVLIDPRTNRITQVTRQN